MKKILWVIGAMLISFPSFSLCQEALFPHRILVDDKEVVRLEELSAPKKIEVSGLRIEIDYSKGKVRFRGVVSKKSWTLILA